MLWGPGGMSYIEAASGCRPLEQQQRYLRWTPELLSPVHVQSVSTNTRHILSQESSPETRPTGNLLETYGEAYRLDFLPAQIFSNQCSSSSQISLRATVQYLHVEPVLLRWVQEDDEFRRGCYCHGRPLRQDGYMVWCWVTTSSQTAFDSRLLKAGRDIPNKWDGLSSSLMLYFIRARLTRLLSPTQGSLASCHQRIDKLFSQVKLWPPGVLDHNLFIFGSLEPHIMPDIK